MNFAPLFVHLLRIINQHIESIRKKYKTFFSDNKLEIIFVSIAIFSFLLPFHTPVPNFFHEVGHAQNCLLQNGTVKEFVIGDNSSHVRCKGVPNADEFLFAGFFTDNMISLIITTVPPVSLIGGFWFFSRSCIMISGGYDVDFYQMSSNEFFFDDNFRILYMLLGIIVLSISALYTYKFWDWFIIQK